MASSIPTRQPQQARSRDTRERILSATEDLLATRLFEDLSVAEIVSSARCTVGSFYHLFGEKDALLPELYLRHTRDVEDRLQRLFRATRGVASLSQRIRKLSKTLVQSHRQQRGLLRALVLRSQCHQQPTMNDRPPKMDTVVSRLGDWLIGPGGGRDEIHQAQEVIVMMLAMIRECLLYPNTTAYVLRMSDTRLERSLIAMAEGYLQSSTSDGSRMARAKSGPRQGRARRAR